jgi:hypothetical protein
LNGSTGNRIDFAPVGLGEPATGTRSEGTKIVLYGIAPGVEYALGIAASTLWQTVSNTSAAFKWYGGTTLAATLSGFGYLTLVGGLTAGDNILSLSPTGGVGYATGAGGVVTQATSKATGVTLNKVCGQLP